MDLERAKHYCHPLLTGFLQPFTRLKNRHFTRINFNWLSSLGIPAHSGFPVFCKKCSEPRDGNGITAGYRVNDDVNCCVKHTFHNLRGNVSCPGYSQNKLSFGRSNQLLWFYWQVCAKTGVTLPSARRKSATLPEKICHLAATPATSE